MDDTLFGGSSSFLALEEEKSSSFPNSGRTIIGSDPVRFSGLDIRGYSNEILVDQRYYAQGMEKKTKSRKMSFVEFRSMRQKLAYVAYSSMPDIMVFCSRMAQYTESMFNSEPTEPLRLIHKANKVLHSGPSLNGLKFKSIPLERMEVVVCIDAAFATNPDKSSQLGVLAMLRDKKEKTVNIIHFLSSKSKRVCKKCTFC